MSLVRVLKSKDFFRVWLTQIFSLTTAHMLNFVLIDKIFKVSGSTLPVGFFFVLYYLPTALLGSLVGVLIDRWNKKKILIFSNFFQAFIVLLYFTLKEKVWPIFVIVLFYSFFDEFLNPAVGASLPTIVKKKFLPTANGFFFLTTQSSLGLGYLLGGLILRFFESANAAFVFAIAALLLASLVASGISRQSLKKEEETKLNWLGFKKELLEGYGFIQKERRVLFPILLLAGLQVLVGMTMMLLPSISQQILKISFANSPFVFIVPAFLGAALGNIFVGKTAKARRKKDLIAAGLLATGFLILIFVLGVPGFKLALPLAVVLTLALGMAFILVFVPSFTLVQEHTPVDVRGRVFATLNTMITLAAAVPTLATATLVDLFGVRTILLVASLAIVILGFYVQKEKYALLGNNHRS